MRLRSIVTPLAVGVAGYAILRHQRSRRAARAAAPEYFASDPLDPVQGLDEAAELQVVPLDVDALSQEDVAAAQDLAVLESKLDEREGTDTGDGVDPVIELAAETRDAGDLYGAHTPVAADREHLDDDRAFDEGQNWVEALAASAIENGPEAERTLDDIVDDEDVLSPPHPSDSRDRPVADHGSGGRRGL
jgi:hypothetical protein